MPPLTPTLRLPVLQSDDDATAGTCADEFPRGVPWSDVHHTPLARRTMLQSAAALAGLSALGACFRQPPEHLVPYRERPVDVRPGVPLHYATATVMGGIASPLLVRSREGRPVKIEGNPEHPWSRGATGPIEQAELLELYDGERLRTYLRAGRPAARQEAFEAITRLGEAARADGGARLRLLVEPDSSPLLASLRARVLERFPRARVSGWAPLTDDAAREGAELARGEPLATVPDLGRARVVVSFGADVLTPWCGGVRHAREYTSFRDPQREMNRLYAVESTVTITGMFADHRLRARPGRMPSLILAFTRFVADELGDPRLRDLAEAAPPDARAQPDEKARRFLLAAAQDAVNRRGASLVLAGPDLAPEWHALAHALNDALGSPGQTISHHPWPLTPTRTGPAELAALAEELRQGAVDTLIVTAHDPIRTAPADLDLQTAFLRAKTVIALASRPDETTTLATWVLPAAHRLESWGDARSPDGLVSLTQPLIEPLFGGVTEAELLSALLGEPDIPPYELLRRQWPSPSFSEWLMRGFIPDSAPPARTPPLRWDAVRRAVASARLPPSTGLELHITPDYRLYDGRYGHNAWLQELPDPVTKLSWDVAARLSPRTASDLGVATGDILTLTLGSRTIEIPAFVLPGQADATVTIPLSAAHPLRTSTAPWWRGNLQAGPTGRRRALANTQVHGDMHGRELAPRRTRAAWRADTFQLQHLRSPQETLYESWTYDDAPYRWGMAIDLGRCIGCAACVVACQAENNIPSVGREQVRRGREMHWLRIDRYFIGDTDDPAFITQPLMCVHCEHAPCEYVCPVNATVHSDEGLNEMVYNRCIGTRYCSNNCPYKVRRFNFLAYEPDPPPLARLYRNPDVTVRALGVMEKCTYCVQRIERARIDARIHGERIDTGRLQTACQQACPTEAIVFGDLQDRDGRVYRLHRDDRAYELLHELGTRPRTRHLARVVNPNEALT